MAIFFHNFAWYTLNTRFINFSLLFSSKSEGENKSWSKRPSYSWLPQSLRKYFLLWYQHLAHISPHYPWGHQENYSGILLLHNIKITVAYWLHLCNISDYFLYCPILLPIFNIVFYQRGCNSFRINYSASAPCLSCLSVSLTHTLCFCLNAFCLFTIH